MEVKKSSSKVSSEEVFASCSFSSLGLDPKLCDQLKERLGYEVPTLVQAQAIPVIVSGRHVLVNAATGTGKTLAYLAPVIHHLQKYEPKIDRSDGTFALVLVPTRELCMQVLEILQKILHRFHWIVPGYIMGGEKRSKEKARLRKGRLLDHLRNTSSFLYKNLRWVIFDEADRILELGFGKDIEEILDILGSRQQSAVAKDDITSRYSHFQRQNLLLSATLNEKVNHLAKISLENPVLIGLNDKKVQLKSFHEHVGPVESDLENEMGNSGEYLCSSDEFKLPAQLAQRYVKVPCGARLVVLLSILKHLFEREASQKIVVFFSTCDAVDFHYSLATDFQWPPNSQMEAEFRQMFLGCKIFRSHGKMDNEKRRATFQAFKSEKSALLLSTDVAARGLDFPKVRYIIQYDSPGEAAEYVHRVGRTARLGEEGESLLFLQLLEIDYLQDLEKHGVVLGEYPLLKMLDGFSVHGVKKQVKNLVTIERHPWVLSLQKALETFISTTPKIKKLAQNAFWSWVKAYSTHRGELKRIFVVQKLHLGHVTKSFALKEQPSLVSKSNQKEFKKRKRDEKQKGISKKRKFAKKS
ncbi:DEAD-box ATP-dependent RNA helicase 17 isoform X2 [Coffea eugenioides]|uniref:DEAD-box ATP-dependent RNA helicase 17 isoform X2 n=1 Tax=Coffea eugenioides TaxID=49369 RepID=UPI000F609CC6|nr:DEAD-box ATP-dependent RNA helicase 17 isoform X2 [Coffea eugenioides]